MTGESIISKQRSTDELAKAFSLITYEYETLKLQYGVHKKLQSQFVLQMTSLGKWEVQNNINDCLIIFCVYARNLANFFLKRCKKRPDDIKIEDFGLSYSIFGELSSDGFSKDIVDRISKEISHLTYQSITDYKIRTWDIDTIFECIETRYQIFDEKIGTNCREVKMRSLIIDTDLYKKLYSNN